LETLVVREFVFGRFIGGDLRIAAFIGGRYAHDFNGLGVLRFAPNRAEDREAKRRAR
jgi:hypothetical protein